MSYTILDIIFRALGVVYKLKTFDNVLRCVKIDINSLC